VEALLLVAEEEEEAVEAVVVVAAAGPLLRTQTRLQSLLQLRLLLLRSQLLLLLAMRHDGQLAANTQYQCESKHAYRAQPYSASTLRSFLSNLRLPDCFKLIFMPGPEWQESNDSAPSLITKEF